MGYVYTKNDGTIASLNLRGTDNKLNLTDIIDFDDVFNTTSKRYYYLVVDNTSTGMDEPETNINIQLELYNDTNQTWDFYQFSLPYNFSDADGNYYYSFTSKFIRGMRFDENSVPTPTPTPGGYTFLTKAELQVAVDAWDADSISATETYGDISTWNVSAITDMSDLFNGKQNITTLDLSGWDTSNVTDMSAMFRDCSNLTSLNVSNFDTSSVTDMGVMFMGCSALTSLNVSNFNTSNVTRMPSMFSGCSALTSLDVSKFDTSSSTILGSMFYDCSSLTSLDVSKFDTSSVKTFYMMGMFNNCSSLTSLNVSSFNTSNLTHFALFKGCSSLTSLDLSNFDTSDSQNLGLVHMGDMFNGCSSLTSLDLSNFDTSRVDNMSYMFNGCSSLTSLNLSNFNTRWVDHMDYMFSGCTALTNLDISNWCVTQVDDVEPSNFATDAPFANDPDNLPVWGTCPTPTPTPTPTSNAALTNSPICLTGSTTITGGTWLIQGTKNGHPLWKSPAPTSHPTHNVYYLYAKTTTTIPQWRISQQPLDASNVNFVDSMATTSSPELSGWTGGITINMGTC